MRIEMAGIDHNKASIEYRELFSFTKGGAVDAMKLLKEKLPIKGCIIISTCNRTELWISKVKNDETKQGQNLTPYEMLCRLKGVDASAYRNYFIEREGDEAVGHLMELTCGLDSKILGEDQIISQVREAMLLSRKNKCTDMVLDKIFQTAIGAAKKVKSKVQLSAADGSAAFQTIKLLKDKRVDLKGVPCLIIGNGQMGKLVANALLDQGADVKMTLRKKMHGGEVTESLIPEGCKMISYEDRIQELSSAEVVISATRSPHYTLKKDEVEGKLNNVQSIWIDLAVPRDIEPSISALNGVTLFDIDNMESNGSRAGNNEAIDAANKIIKEYMNELKQWFAFRERVPEIKNIVKLSVDDVIFRMNKPVKQIELHEEDKKQLQRDMEKAVEKAVGKLLFGLKDTLRDSLWEECLDAVYSAASKDTLKS